MELIQAGSKIDFVGFKNNALVLSGALILIGLLSLIVRGGPNYGIDFTGGTIVQVRFEGNQTIDEIREVVNSLELGTATIQDLGQEFGDTGAEDSSEFLMRLPLVETDMGDASKLLTDALTERYGQETYTIQRIETVGPRVGQSLRNQAIMAVLFATLMMGAYIWFRFELRFGIGAYGALVHDVLITVGALSLFNFEIDLTVVAALLTVVGFSVNDTVIISDRIRENMGKLRREPLGEIINTSINQTLSRTLLTTGTAVFVILSLFFLGGNVIHGFAFTLLVGFLVGTYSSIFIASPIVLRFETVGTPQPKRKQR